MLPILIGLFLIALGVELGLKTLGFDIPVLRELGNIMTYIAPIIIIYIGIRMIIGSKKEKKNNS